MEHSTSNVKATDQERSHYEETIHSLFAELEQTIEEFNNCPIVAAVPLGQDLSFPLVTAAAIASAIVA